MLGRRDRLAQNQLPAWQAGKTHDQAVADRGAPRLTCLFAKAAASSTSTTKEPSPPGPWLDEPLPGVVSGISTQAEALKLAHSVAPPWRDLIAASRDPDHGDEPGPATAIRSETVGTLIATQHSQPCPRDWQSLIDGLRLSRGLCPPGTANGGHRS